MAFVIRWINMVVLFAAFALALAATTPVPLYTYSLDGKYDQHGKLRATLWTLHTGTISVDTGATGQSVSVPEAKSVRINYLNCTQERSKFRAMQAFSIASTIFGFYAFMFCAIMCFCKLKMKLSVFLFTLLAFICELVLVIIAGVVFSSSSCKGKTNYFPSFKTSGYKLAVGFILMIVSAALFLIACILTPFTQELWCGKS